MAIAAESVEPQSQPTVATSLARCPICGRIVGVIYGDVLVIQRGGDPIRTGLNEKIAIPCVSRTCYGVWKPGPEPDPQP